MLAAGRGLRFGGDAPKPLLELGGRPLVRARARRRASAAGCAPVVVVVSDDRVAAAVVPPDGAVVVRNDAPERGIASSLQAALRALEPDADVDAVVVGLADQPLVGAEAYRRVAGAYDDGARLAVATYGGVRGNPVLIGREHWPEALALAGDEGARVLLRRHGAVEVPCDGTGDADRRRHPRRPRRARDPPTGEVMEIADSFRVSTPIDDTWKVLLDIEGIAPCLPGAQLQEIEGDEYRGVVKVKVGPITAQYKGTATLAEVDEAGAPDRASTRPGATRAGRATPRRRSSSR